MRFKPWQRSGQRPQRYRVPTSASRQRICTSPWMTIPWGSCSDSEAWPRLAHRTVRRGRPGRNPDRRGVGQGRSVSLPGSHNPRWPTGPRRSASGRFGRQRENAPTYRTWGVGALSKAANRSARTDAGWNCARSAISMVRNVRSRATGARYCH